MQEIKDIIEAGRLVIKECPNEYAKEYARNINIAEAMYGDPGVKTQALYILSNITHWRGDTAKAVRAFLKDYTRA